jgi:hypothetical protein
MGDVSPIPPLWQFLSLESMVRVRGMSAITLLDFACDGQKGNVKF